MRNIFTPKSIFLIAVILNITALYLIIKKFFRSMTVSGKKSLWNIAAKIFLVIVDLVLAYGVFWAIALGLWFISADGIFYKGESIYISDFITGLVLLETAIFLPYGLNLLLYKLWYKKTGLSKWWIFPYIIIGALVFVVCVFYIISEGYISDWSTVQWI